MDLESELRLDEDAAEVAAFLAENGGAIEAAWRPGEKPEPGEEPGVYWLTLRPISAKDERYYVRVGWIRYPSAPPSVKFARAVRGSLTDIHAWPNVPGYRPGNFDICAEWTKEGHEAHPEWAAQGRWPTAGNPFLWVAHILQGDLDRRYGGRAG